MNHMALALRLDIITCKCAQITPVISPWIFAAIKTLNGCTEVESKYEP
jgi:hypothetical protein